MYLMQGTVTRRWIVLQNKCLCSTSCLTCALSSRGAPSTGFDSKRFISADAARRYGFFASQTIAAEVCSSLGVDDPARELLDQAGLSKTVTQIVPYDSEVVYEFWANLPTVKVEGNSVDVLVRDWMYEFSPSRINALFCLQSVDVREQKLQTAAILEEDLALFLSGGQVKTCKQLVSTAIKDLVIKDLNKICCSNCSPTVNTGYLSANRAMVIYMIMHFTPFVFGRKIYDQIIQLGLHAKSGLHPLFPSLIHQLFEAQHPVPSLQQQDTKKTKGKKTVSRPAESILRSGTST